MKRRSVLSLLGLTFSIVVLVHQSAAEDHVAVSWQTDAESAWRSAHSAQKPLLLYVSMDNCVYCRKMEKNTFADQAVVSDIEESFVAASVAAESRSPLVRKLRVRSFPTTVIISPSAGVLAYIRGYVEPKEFRADLATAVKKEEAKRP
ncbi:MAG: thioredoxin fold domain-containing protein [Planctomycetes bacterium]|nr:thioredoxin fold domain-containing protein [Planctomycetota bacterium]MBL7043421.1 thioredoxin fold domain-containing protein [Pirellulaceae bacterium]